ncbi:MAG: DHH family phosphoesterase, partial [Synergistaceae bacterium]|nr:DHH family phosphoesterase [Synergistaceae bacterium]
MRLGDLTDERIAIQCHDNPDADALASGFGLWRFFTAAGRDVKFFYRGPAVRKPNLLGMIEELSIPVERAPDIKKWDGLLITADCQHGAGNVSRVEAPRVAVIDHHIQEGELPELRELCPWLGSCSTLVWKLLSDESFPIDIKLGTALYYGLFTDTGGFSDVRHPLDRDMWDAVPADHAILRKLRKSNLSMSDLSVASAALSDLRFDEARRFVVISAPPCDPNLLGFMSDLAMEVDKVDIAVACSEGADAIKFSVRSAAREAKASDLAAWIAKGIGSGGGHKDKAGGGIARSKYADRFGDTPIAEWFGGTIRDYLDGSAIIDCSEPDSAADRLRRVGAMKSWRKLPARLGFVPCHRLFGDGAPLQVRMLEGDIDIDADEDTILMIGLGGEVYPTTLEKFIGSYTLIGERFDSEFPYPPAVLNKNTGERLSLTEHAETC